MAFDLQGLLKSAVLARLSGAQRVVGFSSAYLRERLARPFYTDVYDPGGGGMYDPRERSHVVQMNLGLLTTIGVTVGGAGISDRARRHRDRARDARACGEPLRARQSRRGVAEQALAGRALRRAVARAIDERHGLKTIVSWGPGEEPLAQEVVRESCGRGAAVAEDVDRRSPRAHSRRDADDFGRHRSDAHRRGPRHADRRHLRSDPPVAQRTVGARRHHHLARRRLPVPSSSPLHARTDVPARRRGGRSASRRGRTPSCGRMWPAMTDRDAARSACALAGRAWICLRRARAVAGGADGCDARGRHGDRHCRASACACGRRDISTRRAKSPYPVPIAGSRILSTSGRRSWASGWRSRRTASRSPVVIALYLAVTLTAADQERGSVSAPRVRRSLRSLPPWTLRCAASGAPTRAGFSLAQAMANREHRALVGLAVGCIAARVEGNV